MIRRFLSIFSMLLAGCLLVLAGCSSDGKKFENFMSQTTRFFDHEEYDKALIQAKNAAALKPESEKAQAMLAQIFIRLNEPQKALNTYLKLEKLDPDDLDVKFEIASFYFLFKQMDKTEEKLALIFEKNPNYIKAMYLEAAVLSRKKGSIQELIQIYEKILSIEPDQIKAHIVLSGLFTETRQYEKAQKTLVHAMEIQPRNIAIYKAMYALYLSQNKMNQLQATLNKLIKEKLDEYETCLMLGNHYIFQKQDIKAVEKLEQAISLAPAKPGAYLVLASLYSHTGKPVQAEYVLEKALGSNPQSAKIRMLLAQRLFLNQKVEKAKFMVDAMLAERPDFSDARLLKGKILLSRHENAKAVLLFRDLVKNEPGSADYNYLLGTALYADKNFQKAAFYFSSAIENKADHYPSRMMMARIHFAQKDYTLAQIHLDAVLKKWPKDYDAGILMGRVLQGLEKYSAAADIFQSLIDQHPQKVQAFHFMGMLEKLRKNYKAAADFFVQAIKLSPDNMESFTSLVSLYSAQKEYDRALNLCDTYLPKLKESPSNAAIVLNLKAMVLLRTKQREKGKLSLEQSIEKEPNFMPPYLTLAKIYASQGNFKKAETTYQSLIEKRPDRPEPFNRLGALYERQGNLDKAQTQYKKALEISPDFPLTLNNLAYLYASQNKKLTQALEMAKLAKLARPDDPGIIDTLGWVYFKKELYPSARDEFKSAVQLQPKNPIFQYHLGLAYYKSWEYAKAKASLKQALALEKNFDGSQQAINLLKQM